MVPPVLVSVTLCDCVIPTLTLPKASLPGFAASCPSLIPVPDKEISVSAVEASLPIAAVALKLPAAFGLNASVSDALCPAAIVTGRLGAVNEKYFVDTDALLMLADVFPVLLTESVSTCCFQPPHCQSPTLVLQMTNFPSSRRRSGLVEVDDLELKP